MHWRDLVLGEIRSATSRPISFYINIWYFMLRCIGWISSRNNNWLAAQYIMARILINAWCFFFYPFLTWNPTGAVKASRNNLRRNSFLWLFLFSFHERMGKCPCLVLVLQQVLLSVYSSFCFPLMKAEQWQVHAAPTTWL